MQTLNAQWLEYWKLCHPNGTEKVQETETHQAFFAGCLCAMNSCVALAELSNEEAERELSKLIQEAEQTCAIRAGVMKARN